jgi:hypothetical protein
MKTTEGVVRSSLQPEEARIQKNGNPDENRPEVPRKTA